MIESSKEYKKKNETRVVVDLLKLENKNQFSVNN